MAAVAVPKRVAIIGGGSSGLAAYRHITFHPNLKATLFEASAGLGGLWSSEHPHHRPAMTTNLSRHTMTFSDMTWPEELSTYRQDMFPRARDVGRYLQLYAKRHLQEGDLRLHTKVTNIEHSGEKWQVTSYTSNPNEGEERVCKLVDEFDYLVIASGFFSAPYTPSLPGLVGTRVAIQHSADFKAPESYRGQKVVLIGGSLSAAEIAGQIMPYAAKIHHVHSRPFFVVSRYLPTNTVSAVKEAGKPNFLPLDLVFFRWSIRPDVEGPLQPTPEMNRQRNAILSSLFPLTSFSMDPDRPPMLGISDQYIAGMRAGIITSHLAKLDRIDQDGTLRLSTQDHIESPDVVIFCTGYTTLLPFLSASLQEAIKYRADNQYVPFLTDHLVIHPNLPNAGFVGVYRGPDFAVMELQARYLASLFAGKTEWPKAEDMKQGVDLELSLRELDKEYRPQFPHGDYGGLMEKYARFLGLPSRLPRATKSPPNSIDESAVDDIVLAVNHPLARTPDVEAIESDVVETLRYSLRGGWVSAAVFHSWCGRWKVHRVILDHTFSGMSGTFEGLATFYPRAQSALPKDVNKSSSSHASCLAHDENGSASISALEVGNEMWEEGVLEYLYHEHGTFTSSTGVTFPAEMKYIYRYQTLTDTISAWFCKGAASAEVSQGGELDYWFHDIVIEAAGVSATNSNSNDATTVGHDNWFKQHQRKGGWTAAGTEHLCVRDLYRPVYKFCFEGAELREFGIGYRVEGPEKEYVSEAWYERA